MKKRRFVSMLTAAVLTVTGYWPGSVLTASAEPYSGAAQMGRADIAYSDNTRHTGHDNNCKGDDRACENDCGNDKPPGQHGRGRRER